jgi:hypothetical protein
MSVPEDRGLSQNSRFGFLAGIKYTPNHHRWSRFFILSFFILNPSPATPVAQEGAGLGAGLLSSAGRQPDGLTLFR